MTRISRIVARGYPHHVTQRGVRSMDIFHSNDERRSYLQAVKEETDRFGVETEDFSGCLRWYDDSES